MDNSINNNITFGTTVVLPKKGNKKLLDAVTRKFGKMSSDVPGTLYIYKASGVEGSDFYTELSYNGIKFVTSKFNELLKSHKTPNKSNIEDFTQKLFYTFKAMLREQKYNRDSAAIRDEISNVQKSINKKFSDIKYALKINDTETIKFLNAEIETLKGRISELKDNLAVLQSKFINSLNKYKNKGLDLESYISGMESNFKFGNM